MPVARREREKSLEEDRRGVFWIRHDGQDRLATENLVPGNQVYGERLLARKGVEYRLWDPFRSKLAASIHNGLEAFPFGEGSVVLYLGASTGTTVSHVSDIVGGTGMVFGVENASRVARDFLDRVASHRRNIMPIMRDARRPEGYFSIYGKVDVIYSDIAQQDQTDIAITNCKAYLKEGGYLFLVIKIRSISATRSQRSVINGEIGKLGAGFEIIQEINLEPYDKEHAMVIARLSG